MGDHRVGLQRTMLHLLRVECVVKDFVGFSKAAIDIALGEDRLMGDVGSENRMPAACERAIEPIGT